MATKEAKQKKIYEQKAATIGSWQERIAELLFILLMCALPMYLNEDRYIGLAGQKFWFFFWGMCFIVACILVVWIYAVGWKPWIPIGGKLSVADCAVLGFAAITVLSALLSPYRDAINVWVGREEPNGRYDGAITQVMYVAAFLIISKWYRPRRRDFAVFGFSAIVISLLGIFQFYGMDFFKLYPNHIPGLAVADFYDIWFRTTIGNVNIVSSYACVAVLLCGVLYIKVKLKWRFLWLISGALGAWLLVLARSDSGVVGTVVAASVALPFIIRGMKDFGRLLVLVSACLLAVTLQMLLYDVNIVGSMAPGDLYPYAAVAAALLAFGLAAVKFGKEADLDAPINLKPRLMLLAGIIVCGLVSIEIVGRNESVTMIYQIREIMHGRFEDHYVSDRIFIWRHALMAFPNRPIIGTGPDTFYFALVPEAHELFGASLDKAHNEYIQILICQGVLGVACYFVFLGAVLTDGIKNAYKDPIVMAVTVAFIGYCVQAFFNISLPIVSQMMWVMAGIMAGAMSLGPPLAVREHPRAHNMRPY